MVLTPPSPAQFDRVAGPYETVERLAFGRVLKDVRFHFLPRLSSSRRLLLLGDGDGRALRKIVALAPHADIDSLDASGAMLAKSARGVPAREQHRIRWIRTDALRHPYPRNEYDAIVAFFFLDCFTPAELDHLFPAVLPSLRPGGLWLHADFAMPENGFARQRAKILLALMHTFFRVTTGLHARSLLDLETRLSKTGLLSLETASFQRGFLKASVFQKPGSL